MKKFIFFFTFLALTMTVMAQSQRQMVLSEDFTSTLCTYCPGAAMGMDDLLTNGKYVAVVESHSLGMGYDPYANTYSTARNTMYGVSAFPSVCFDAVKGYVGGNHSSSMYSTYLPLYNACIAITSPVTISMAVTNNGLNYTAVITLVKTDVISSSNNVLYFFVTESNISYNWEGQTKLDHVNRLMVPDQNGTAISFASGNTQVITLNFAMDASWVLTNCEFIASLQDMDAGQGNIPGTSPYYLKEYKVYQTIKQGAVNLTPDFDANTTSVPLNGSVTFTNLTSGGYVGTPETFHWIFQGATPDTSDDASPTVVYTECGSHDVTLIANNGGQIDTLTKSLYITVGPYINMLITPKDTACSFVPITLDATTNGATSYLWTPGGFTTPSITVDESTIGLGLHSYTVAVSDGNCTNTQTKTIFYEDCTGIPQNNTGMSTTIYPNPNRGNFTLEMNSLVPQNVNIVITNSLGVKVYSENDITFSGKLLKSINLNVPSGVYFLSVLNSGKNNVQKFLVN
jgi:PKD repeat protein